MPEISQQTYDVLVENLAHWRELHPGAFDPKRGDREGHFRRLCAALDADPAFAPPPLENQINELAEKRGWYAYRGDDCFWIEGDIGAETFSWPVALDTKLTAAEIVAHVLALAGEDGE